MTDAADELARLCALYRYKVLDSPPEQDLDDLTALAGQLCGAPISAVSLVDSDRQWFKSAQGLTVRQTQRDGSFCNLAIEQSLDVLEVRCRNRNSASVDSLKGAISAPTGFRRIWILCIQCTRRLFLQVEVKYFGGFVAGVVGSLADIIARVIHGFESMEVILV